VVVSYHIPAEGDLAAAMDQVDRGLFTVHAEFAEGGQWLQEGARAQFGAGAPPGSTVTLTCLAHTPTTLSFVTPLKALFPLGSEGERAAALGDVRLRPREALECLGWGEPVTLKVVDGAADRAIFRLPDAPHKYSEAPDALAQFLEKEVASGFFVTEKWTYTPGQGVDVDVVLAGASQTNIIQSGEYLGQESTCLTPLPAPSKSASDRRAQTTPAATNRSYTATVDYLFEEPDVRDGWNRGTPHTPLSREQFLDLFMALFQDVARGEVAMVECKNGEEGRPLTFAEFEALLVKEYNMPVFDLETGEAVGEETVQVEVALDQFIGWRTQEVWTFYSHPFRWEKKVVALELLGPTFIDYSGELEGWTPLIPVRFKFPQG
jgi:hypothetical protein